MIWLKNGANISDSMEAEVNFVGHDSILRINKLGEHHIGNYSCRASNPAGDTDIFFFVEVKGARNLHCTFPSRTKDSTFHLPRRLGGGF